VRLARPPAFGPAGEIALLGYDLEPPAAAGADATREVTLYWQARRRPGRSYTVFVHALAPGPGGRLVAQHDGVPGDGARPTDRWRPGAVVPDRHQLALPAPPACGPYRLLVGWYERDTLRRLPTDRADLVAAGPLAGPAPALPDVADVADAADAVELRPVDGAGCGR
jgi:hypothetical protein